MAGWFRTFTRDFKGRPSQGNFNHFVSQQFGPNGTMKGIVFDRNRAENVENEWDGQFVIAAMETSGVEVSYLTSFLADGDGKPVWTSFAKDGSLPGKDVSWVSAGEKLAGAIAVRFTLKPGEKEIVPMVIAWDFPIVEFGQGRQWHRRYTDFYGATGKNAWAIARDGLQNAANWSSAIDRWQGAVRQRRKQTIVVPGHALQRNVCVDRWRNVLGPPFGKRPQYRTNLRAPRVLRLCLLRHAVRELLWLYAFTEVLAGR